MLEALISEPSAEQLDRDFPLRGRPTDITGAGDEKAARSLRGAAQISGNHPVEVHLYFMRSAEYFIRPRGGGASPPRLPHTDPPSTPPLGREPAPSYVPESPNADHVSASRDAIPGGQLVTLV